MVNAPGFQPLLPPPRAAALTANELMLWLEPRSTCSQSPEEPVHHLLLLASVPSTALAGLSPAAQLATLLLAGLFRARLVPRLGAAAGGVQPSLNDGGTSE